MGIPLAIFTYLTLRMCADVDHVAIAGDSCGLRGMAPDMDMDPGRVCTVPRRQWLQSDGVGG